MLTFFFLTFFCQLFFFFTLDFSFQSAHGLNAQWLCSSFILFPLPRWLTYTEIHSVFLSFSMPFFCHFYSFCFQFASFSSFSFNRMQKQNFSIPDLYLVSVFFLFLSQLQFLVADTQPQRFCPSVGPLVRPLVSVGPSRFSRKRENFAFMILQLLLCECGCVSVWQEWFGVVLG